MANILIVDDSPMQAKALAGMLKKNGHTTLLAHDGATGIEIAAREIPDLIMMDVVMPGINGFQATREISRNKSTEHIPIVLVSGKSQETDKYWGMRQGAKGYLVKPLQEAELLNTIEMLLAG